ncbi:hypothetical protein RI367_001009 [Sorochytrium milnesiophthora]
MSFLLPIAALLAWAVALSKPLHDSRASLQWSDMPFLQDYAPMAPFLFHNDQVLILATRGATAADVLVVDWATASLSRNITLPFVLPQETSSMEAPPLTWRLASDGNLLVFGWDYTPSANSTTASLVSVPLNSNSTLLMRSALVDVRPNFTPFDAYFATGGTVHAMATGDGPQHVYCAFNATSSAQPDCASMSFPSPASPGLNEFVQVAPKPDVSQLLLLGLDQSTLWSALDGVLGSPLTASLVQAVLAPLNLTGLRTYVVASGSDGTNGTLVQAYQTNSAKSTMSGFANGHVLMTAAGAIADVTFDAASSAIKSRIFVTSLGGPLEVLAASYGPSVGHTSYVVCDHSSDLLLVLATPPASTAAAMDAEQSATYSAPVGPPQQGSATIASTSTSSSATPTPTPTISLALPSIDTGLSVVQSTSVQCKSHRLAVRFSGYPGDTRFYMSMIPKDDGLQSAERKSHARLLRRRQQPQQQVAVYHAFDIGSSTPPSHPWNATFSMSPSVIHPSSSHFYIHAISNDGYYLSTPYGVSHLADLSMPTSDVGASSPLSKPGVMAAMVGLPMCALLCVAALLLTAHRRRTSHDQEKRLSEPTTYTSTSGGRTSVTHFESPPLLSVGDGTPEDTPPTPQLANSSIIKSRDTSPFMLNSTVRLPVVNSTSRDLETGSILIPPPLVPIRSVHATSPQPPRTNAGLGLLGSQLMASTPQHTSWFNMFAAAGSSQAPMHSPLAQDDSDLSSDTVATGSSSSTDVVISASPEPITASRSNSKRISPTMRFGPPPLSALQSQLGRQPNNTSASSQVYRSLREQHDMPNKPRGHLVRFASLPRSFAPTHVPRSSYSRPPIPILHAAPDPVYPLRDASRRAEIPSVTMQPIYREQPAVAAHIYTTSPSVGIDLGDGPSHIVHRSTSLPHPYRNAPQPVSGHSQHSNYSPTRVKASAAAAVQFTQTLLSELKDLETELAAIEQDLSSAGMPALALLFFALVFLLFVIPRPLSFLIIALWLLS